MILLLGGTFEARLLAAKLKGCETIYSLAGRTENPLPIANVTIRIDGFGGVSGLISFLKEQSVTAIINAAHPYAARISHNAYLASRRTSLPLIRFLRPAWQKISGDIWEKIAKNDIALKIAKADGPILATLGAQGAASILGKDWKHRVYIRSTEEAPQSLAKNIHWVQARGPFLLDNEIGFLRDQNITALLCRNSGGSASYAKIEAARYLGIPVWMIQRPGYFGACVSTIEESISWLENVLPGRKI